MSSVAGSTIEYKGLEGFSKTPMTQRAQPKANMEECQSIGMSKEKQILCKKKTQPQEGSELLTVQTVHQNHAV